MILVMGELNRAASTNVGHALYQALGYFNSLSEKRRKIAANKSWGSVYELVDMLNKDYPPCPGAPFKDNVKRAVSIYFNYKQCFDELNWD